MPRCFQLFKKGTYNAVKLGELDDIICREVLKCEPHPKFYGGDKFNWFDSIGFIIATTNDCELGSDKLKDKVLKEWFPNTEDSIYHVRAKNVLEYLEENYSSTAFYMSKS